MNENTIRAIRDTLKVTSEHDYRVWSQIEKAIAAALPPLRAREEEWPEPAVLNPDIAEPTGVPYIDSLLHRTLDAQQDINAEANERMSQPLCNASALIDEIENVIRILFSTAGQEWRDISAPEGWQLLPEYPTDEMMEAGLYQCSPDMKWEDLFSAYRDMLAQAPVPPVAEPIVAEQRPDRRGGAVAGSMDYRTE